MLTSEMRKVVSEAEITLCAADNMASDMAIILCGRLREVEWWVVRDLKKELKNFNAHTNQWKN